MKREPAHQGGISLDFAGIPPRLIFFNQFCFTFQRVLTPVPSSKFKSGSSGPPAKFKSVTFIIAFIHCYIYNIEITFHE